MDLFQSRFLVVCLSILCALACEQRKELIDQALYEGPTSSLDSISTFLSDSGKFVMHIKAPKQSEFESGDIEWEAGVQVDYFDKKGAITTLFEANYLYYTKKEALYHAKGNVIVKNNETGDELTTEELFWDEQAEEYYTDKFVTIKSDGEVHTGEGLKADQGFTSYQILKPSGTFSIEENPAGPAPLDVAIPPATLQSGTPPKRKIAKGKMK